MAYPDLDSYLREGFTMRRLPLVPQASILAEIPLLYDCFAGNTSGTPLAHKVFEAITSYNHMLKLVAQPGSPELWKPSAEIVEQTMKINEVVQKAHEEVSGLTDGLLERLDSFNKSVSLRGSHFRDGQWMRECR